MILNVKKLKGEDTLKIGYDRYLTKKKKELLKSAGTLKNYSRFNSTQTDSYFFENFLLRHPRSEVILINLDSIGEVTFEQLYKTFSIIDENEITLTFLQHTISGLEIKQDFNEVVRHVIYRDRKIAIKRVNKGIAHANSKGKFGGRPTISDAVKKQIYWLYTEKKMSLRNISEIMNVSLGSVHKYSKVQVEEK